MARTHTLAIFMLAIFALAAVATANISGGNSAARGTQVNRVIQAQTQVNAAIAGNVVKSSKGTVATAVAVNAGQLCTLKILCALLT